MNVYYNLLLRNVIVIIIAVPSRKKSKTLEIFVFFHKFMHVYK